MKRTKFIILGITIIFCIGLSSKAQNRSSYNNKLIDSRSLCNCLLNIDSTFTLALSNNDDLTTSIIYLPFSFCFYGQNVDSVYINNNGNISMGSPYGSFSSFPFPFSPNNMIAPFWADVDTRDTLGGIGINGNVYYKITPAAFIVRWNKVGYYMKQGDKLNDFQLILTNSLDTLIPGGNNLEFCYGDMQWTTGSASGGVNGFGGLAATVGINRGDGVEYMQVGRFDQSGVIYDGGYGANDGVDWLDNKTVIMNTCGATGPTSLVLDELCDTINTSSLSTNNIENRFEIKLSPNPCFDYSFINLYFEKASNVSIVIYSIDGSLVVKKDYGFLNGSVDLPLDVTKVTGGMYFVNVIINGSVSVLKLIRG